MNPLVEHDYEPIPGLPAVLPEGEYVLWSAKPDTADLAISALHLRKVAVYFAALIALRVLFQWREGAVMAEAVSSTLALSALALLGLGLLALLPG